jgi:hypothetical protein
MDETIEDFKKKIDALPVSDLYDIYNNIDQDQFKPKYEYVKSKIDILESSVARNDGLSIKYLEELKTFKKQRKKAVYTFLSFLPVFAIIGLFLHSIVNDVQIEYPIYLSLFLIYGGYSMYQGIKILNFNCPKCGKKFMVNEKGFFRSYNVFTNDCLNCGFNEFSLFEKQRSAP